MLRKIILPCLCLLALCTTTMAQTGEFPWQLGRGGASQVGPRVPMASTVRLAAPTHPDGAATVLIYDRAGTIVAQSTAVVRNEEVILALPRNLTVGVYFYRIVSNGLHSEGKLMVARG